MPVASQVASRGAPVGYFSSGRTEGRILRSFEQMVGQAVAARSTWETGSVTEHRSGRVAFPIVPTSRPRCSSSWIASPTAARSPSSVLVRTRLSPLTPRVLAGELKLLMIDISQEELDKAPAVGQKLCLDVATKKFPLVDQVDLACSQMLAEHVRDGQQLLRNVARLLRPGALYLQLSPTLYTLPFVVNRVLPEKVSRVLLDTFQPRDPVRRGKFPGLLQLVPRAVREADRAHRACGAQPGRGAVATSATATTSGCRCCESWRASSLRCWPATRCRRCAASACTWWSGRSIQA